MNVTWSSANASPESRLLFSLFCFSRTLRRLLRLRAAVTSSPLRQQTGERERWPPGRERRDSSSPPVSPLAQLPGVAWPPTSRLLLARLAFSTRYCSRLPANALQYSVRHVKQLASNSSCLATGTSPAHAPVTQGSLNHGIAFSTFPHLGENIPWYLPNKNYKRKIFGN